MAHRDNLTKSLEHLEYEMAMIVAAPRMVYEHPLQEPNDTRPSGYYWANDQAVAYLAGMESALTHARALDDFFKPTSQQVRTLRTARRTRKSNKAKDRYASQYCNPGGWPGFDMLKTREHNRIDRQLSHLTTLRAPRRDHDLEHYAERAIAGLGQLVRHARPKWQGRLQVIFNKANAEQQRISQPWNPQLPAGVHQRVQRTGS